MIALNLLQYVDSVLYVAKKYLELPAGIIPAEDINESLSEWSELIFLQIPPMLARCFGLFCTLFIYIA